MSLQRTSRPLEQATIRSRVGRSSQPFTTAAFTVFVRAGAGTSPDRRRHALGESNRLLHIAGSFEKTRSPWFFSRLNETLALAPFPLRMLGRCPEVPISCSSRKAGLSDGYGPCSTTSGPRLLMGRCPSSTGAQHGSGSCSVQHNAPAHGHKALAGQADQNQRLLATASPVFHVLHRVLGSWGRQNGA
jgi:hypothetical protein